MKEGGSIENNSENSLEKKYAKAIFEYLDPLVKGIFDLEARKEYYDANLETASKKAQEINDRVDNLGITDDIAEEKWKDLQKDFNETLHIIQNEASPEKELDVYSTASFIRARGGGVIESKIEEYFGIPADSWESFVMSLNMYLQGNPFSWDEIRERYIK